MVRKGDKVKGGQVLTEGYATQNGELALGRNLMVAFIPGMSGFLTEKTGNGPTERVPVPIRDEEAQRILGVQDENAVNAAETEVNFTVGESVRITDAHEPGCNLRGVHEEMCGRYPGGGRPD